MVKLHIQKRTVQYSSSIYQINDDLNRRQKVNLKTLFCLAISTNVFKFTFKYELDT